MAPSNNAIAALRSAMTDPVWNGETDLSLARFRVNDDGLWKALPNLTKSDCEYLAAAYRHLEEEARKRMEYYEGRATR